MAGFLSFISKKKYKDTIAKTHGNQMMMQAITIMTVVIGFKALTFFIGFHMPVVISGSMEPGIRRGDLLLVNNNSALVRVGEVVIFQVEKHPIPIVHRVIKIHQDSATGEVVFLTKGDNNPVDDRGLYPNYGTQNNMWIINQSHIVGRVFGKVPNLGWLGILKTEHPVIMYALIGALAVSCFV